MSVSERVHIELKIKKMFKNFKLLQFFFKKNQHQFIAQIAAFLEIKEKYEKFLNMFLNVSLNVGRAEKRELHLYSLCIINWTQQVSNLA